MIVEELSNSGEFGKLDVVAGKFRRRWVGDLMQDYRKQKVKAEDHWHFEVDVKCGRRFRNEIPVLNCEHLRSPKFAFLENFQKRKCRELPELRIDEQGRMVHPERVELTKADPELPNLKDLRNPH